MLINHHYCDHGPGADADLCRSRAKRLPLDAIRWVTGNARRRTRLGTGVVVQRPVWSSRALVAIHSRDLSGRWLPESMLELTAEQAAQLGAALIEASAEALKATHAEQAKRAASA